jgi:hypothetical protein
VHTCTAGQALGAPHARPLPRIRGKHPFYRKTKSADDSVTTRGGAHSGAGEQQVIDALWASQLAAAVARAPVLHRPGHRERLPGPAVGKPRAADLERRLAAFT